MVDNKTEGKMLEPPMDPNAFIPTELEAPESPDLSSAFDAENLAGDANLSKTVFEYASTYLKKHRDQRWELEELWKVEDWMLKCGQDEGRRETERVRTDKTGDTMTETKSQKIGSTLFYKQVRTLLANFAAILYSRKDPYKFKPRSNPEVFASEKQSDDLAHQHDMTMRWSRDQENFTVRGIEFLAEILAHGNVPIYSKWVRKSKEILDRWPVLVDGEQVGTTLERRLTPTENRPEVDYLDNERFYADQNIPSCQKQNCIGIESPASMEDILQGQRNEGYLNVDQITSSFLYKGDDSGVTSQKESSAGYSGATDDTNTGTFMQYDVYVRLPIDETKKGDARWNPGKHEAKIYWVTFVGSLDDAIVTRIQRNPDPHDDMPFDLVHLLPFKVSKNSLYHISLGQLLRGNFTEATTAKQQMIDSKTLQNNRPMKGIKGEVMVEAGGLKFGKDKMFWVDNKESLSEFQLGNVIDNANVLGYIEADSNEVAGTINAVTGAAMGQRTSAAEAENAYEAASLPNKMISKYVFHQWLTFHAMRGVRQWHVYALPVQTIKIMDTDTIAETIRPVELYGDFDVEVTIVDEFERNFMQTQALTWAAQNVFPLFMDVIDKRWLAKQVFDKFLHIDVTDGIRPDMRDESVQRAKMENVMLMQGQYVPPTINEDFDAMLAEHKGERIQYVGVESDERYKNVMLLDRHIQETEYLKQQAGGAQGAGGQAQAQATAAGGSPASPPMNSSAGMAAGNEMASVAGAMQA